MNFLSAESFDDFLAELSKANTTSRQIRVAGGKAKEMAFFRSSVQAKHEIRRAQLEKTECVALNNLSEVHQPAQFFSRRWNFDGQDRVSCLGRSEHMTDRADAANARCDSGQFAHRTAFAELFETAKLGDMKLRIGDIPGIIQENADFCVSLDAGDRIDDNSLSHGLSKFDVSTGQNRRFALE